MKLFQIALMTICLLPQVCLSRDIQSMLDNALKQIKVRSGLSFALQTILDDIIEDIYRIDAQELRDLAPQDLGPDKHIKAEDLHKIMSTNPQLLVINVLSSNWYEDCHIAGSINVPLKELVYTMKDWDPYQPIVVYCALDECDASEKAHILLSWMGFPFVLEYKGGIKEWYQLGYPTEGPCEAKYLHEEGHRVIDCLKNEADTSNQ